MAYDRVQGRVTADGKHVVVACDCGSTHIFERGHGDAYRVAPCKHIAGYVVVETGAAARKPSAV